MKLEALFEGKSIDIDVDDTAEEENNVIEPLETQSNHFTIEEAKGAVSDDDNDVTTICEDKPTSIWVEEPDKVCNVIDDIDGEDLDEDDINDGMVEIDDDLDGESLHDSDLEDEGMI